MPLLIFVVVEKGPIIFSLFVINVRFSRAAFHNHTGDNTNNEATANKTADTFVGLEKKMVYGVCIHVALFLNPILQEAYSSRVYYVQTRL